MKPKTVMVFGAATAVMVVAAVFAVLGQRAPTSIPTDRAFAFPGLLEKVNDVATIEVVSSNHSFEITRTDRGWGLAGKGGYPVSFEKAKSAIVGIAQLKLLEAKTSDPERYARLDVGNPEEKDSKSKHVILSDASGNVLADGIFGRRNTNLFGDAGGGTYLRRGDDERSWLAEGTVEIGATPNDWMVREIVNLDAEDIKRVVIRQPDGAELVVHKVNRNQKKFTVDDIPEGMKLKSENEGKEVAGGLWRLSLEDVKPTSEIEFPQDVHEAEYTTFDGLTVNVDVAIMDEEYWARFSASAEGVEGDEETSNTAAAKAKEINDRVTGWTYRLSIGEGERLTTKKETLIEDLEPAKS